ncbi:enoyl-CoA hydratase [Rhizobiales bacterium GAS191]|nr:enoyl-CoA hydratase [Rhizobiales bacterium GAS191]
MGRVHFSVDGHIATIVLDNPESHNAVDAPMRAEIEASYKRVEVDDAIRVAIIRGAGNGSFCSGGSIDGYLEIKAFGPDGCGPPKIPRPHGSRKPYIAAMLGYALGGGFALALACDLRVAGRSAEMGPTGLKLGAVQGAQTISRLTRLIGQSRALGVLLLSKRLKAEEAERIGLVHEMVDDEAVFDTALAWARTIAEFSPWTVEMTRRLIYEAHHLSFDEAIAWEDRIALEGYRRPEALEGFTAFKERRRPKF